MQDYCLSASGDFSATDDGKIKDIPKDIETLSQVGEISIEIYKASEAKFEERRAVNNDEFNVKTPMTVHEWVMKGQSKLHNTCFEAAALIPGCGSMPCELQDGIEFPLAVFKFKCRSREVLKSLSIIESTPVPDAEPASDNTFSLDKLDAGQKRQLEDFLRELLGNKNASNTPERSIKREGENISGESLRKKPRTGDKVIMDLVED